MVDNFSEFCWTVPLKIRIAQIITNSSENSLKSSKRRPNLTESDDGSEFVNKTLTNLLNNNNHKRYSRNTSLGAVSEQRFNRTIRDLLKKPVFQKVDANWIDVLPTITKQYTKGTHPSTKLTPIHASLKRNEGCLYQNLLDNRK